ncbi:hypothetical protein FCE95_12025 [Luteimonas gilva]|uniref:Uncharacterized protein n=1 Tax=Luteimonas gilva TaxID=2572684 RepID=A0A4U5JPQ3_9GAMM|nr:hypothetical protein [Luteimonas gilva]TKR30816.1 hypothetical protein FCE95_12025 [Luteimonas gilva]
MRAAICAVSLGAGRLAGPFIHDEIAGGHLLLFVLATVLERIAPKTAVRPLADSRMRIPLSFFFGAVPAAFRAFARRFGDGAADACG